MYMIRFRFSAAWISMSAKYLLVYNLCKVYNFPSIYLESFPLPLTLVMWIFKRYQLPTDAFSCFMFSKSDYPFLFSGSVLSSYLALWSSLPSLSALMLCHNYIHNWVTYPLAQIIASICLQLFKLSSAIWEYE